MPAFEVVSICSSPFSRAQLQTYSRLLGAGNAGGCRCRLQPGGFGNSGGGGGGGGGVREDGEER